MNHPIIEKSRTRAARSVRTATGAILIPATLALALLTSGCDKCGDYFWQGGSKSCHDESQVK
jgi:hypothetical protein